MAQVIYRLPAGIAPRPMQRDATYVAGRSADAAEMQQRMNAEARRTPSEDEQILAERKRRKKVAKEARERTGQNPLDLTVQDWADRSADLGDMFRLFPDDPNSFIDDYLNPAVAIGSMASGLGQYPLNVSQGNYGEAALNLAAPILSGAVERGVEMAAGRLLPFSIRDVTPLNIARAIETTDFYRNKVYPKISDTQFYKVGKNLVENPWMYNPFAYKVPEGMMVRGVGPKGVEDLMRTGLVRAKDYPDLYATTHLPAAATFADDYIPVINPLTGRTTYENVRGHIVEFPRSAALEGWTSKYGTDPSAEYWGKGLGFPPTWSEFTPVHSGFPGVPIEKVRILEPRTFMGYAETKASKQLRKQRKK